MDVPSTATSLRIDADVAIRLRTTAVHVFPEEGCGLLLGRSSSDGVITVKQAVVVPNAAPAEARRRRYEISPRLMLEWERIAQRSGLSIVGFFHSHPDAPPIPSATDASLAWPAYAYVIVSVSSQGSDKPWVSGMAAWTFAEASASFVELAVTVEVAADEIEYFI